MRKSAGLCMIVFVVGLASAQTKDKDKKDPNKDRVDGILVKVDVAKKMLVVTIGGKRIELPVGKEVKFIGPRKGETDIKDKRLTPGVVLGLVMDGKTLKEVHIPVITKVKDKDKDKGKDKDKDKVSKDK